MSMLTIITNVNGDKLFDKFVTCAASAIKRILCTKTSTSVAIGVVARRQALSKASKQTRLLQRTFYKAQSTSH